MNKYITIQPRISHKEEIGWRDDNNHPILYDTLEEAEKVIEEDWQDDLNSENGLEVSEGDKDFVGLARWERVCYRVMDLDENTLFFYFPEDEKYIYK